MRPIALVLALLASLNAAAAVAAAPGPRRARRAPAAPTTRADTTPPSAPHASALECRTRSMPPGSCSRARCSSGSARVPDRGDLIEARDALRAVERGRLPQAERYELMVGFGQWLFLTGRFGAAAELFDTALGSAGRRAAAAAIGCSTGGRARSIARCRSRGGDASELYGRVLERMEQEARRDPSSAAAGYWIAAAARGLGRLDRAWQAAMAAWVRTGLTAGSRRGAAGGSRSPGAHGNHPRSRA